MVHPQDAAAYQSGAHVPKLGIGKASSPTAVQFDDGKFYSLNDDGKTVTESSGDAWNISWKPSEDGGVLSLRDCAITDTLYVPGNTTISVKGTCSFNVSDFEIRSAISAKASDGGYLHIDLSEGSSLSITSEEHAISNSNGVNQGGPISLTGGRGSLLTCTCTNESSQMGAQPAIQAYGDLSFGESLRTVISNTEKKTDKGFDIPDACGALSESPNKPKVIVEDSASLTVNGGITSDGNVEVRDSASLALKTPGTDNVSFGFDSTCIVQEGASLSVDSQGTALTSTRGSVKIAGTASLKAGVSDGADSENSKIQGSMSAIRLGAFGEYGYGGAGTVDVTGQLVISRGNYGITNQYGSVAVSHGGSIKVSNTHIAFNFGYGGSLSSDGASIDVSDSKIGVESRMGATDKDIPFVFSAKNGSHVKFSTTGPVFNDEAPEGKPVTAIDFSDSTVELSSGADALATVTQGKPLPLATAYTKDCNALAGASASGAAKLPLEGLSLEDAAYLSIAPVGADWTQGAHEWSSAWSSDDTHHWHVCESSFCTLGDDITQMGGYAEHEFAAYQPNGDATCDEDGTETSSCTCGKTHTRTDADSALGHGFGEWVATKLPTCSEDGVEVRMCSRCDATETRVVKALGHDFGAWAVKSAPTCTETGVEMRSCSRCDATETRGVKALGHDFGTWAVAETPTCTGQGSEQRACSRCDAAEKRVVKALGHDFGAWTVVKEPTCTEQGEGQCTCSRCDVAEHRAIEAMGHSFKDGICTVCGLKDPSYKPAVKPGTSTDQGAPTDQGDRNDQGAPTDQGTPTDRIDRNNQNEQLPETGDPAGILLTALGGVGCLGAGAFASRRRHR